MSEKNQAPSRMIDEVVGFLQGSQLVVVTTLEAESKWPTNNLITWVYAKDAETLRLAADAKGRVMGNIRADERILLTVMAGGSCYCIEGTARVIADEVQGVSLKMAVAEVKVKAFRDITFWGGKITANPQYDVTYDKALKEKLDSGIFAAMKAL